MNKSRPPAPRTQTLTIVAQDPSIKGGKGILTAEIEVPAEALGMGPWGHRVHVIDYDASTDTLYKPYSYKIHTNGRVIDPFKGAKDDVLLRDTQFHCQNVYAIVMRVLARFESALGRRIGWSFEGHQLKVVPHAFADANAFYSRQDEALLFGYFPGNKRDIVLSCLSHDVVAHETTHALVDGLRPRFTNPSSPDQAAFHEGYSDIVALLSVFALPAVVKALLDFKWGNNNSTKRSDRVADKFLTADALRKSALLGLAQQMGADLLQVRGDALRRSVLLGLSPEYYKDDPNYIEPHRRGEILVAAVMNAFVDVWAGRLGELRRTAGWTVNRDRVAEEGAAAADCLLTMCIRALDYCPPLHLEFGDFLSALLTADYEIRPDDAKYQFRKHLREKFAGYGIEPASSRNETESGIWEPPELARKRGALNVSRSHLEPLQRDPDEVFRFIWENRKALGLMDGIYTRVESVRPCVRISGDGFVLRETVAEYVQVARVKARELHSMMQLSRPDGLPLDAEVFLYGGGVLIFDEFGQVKFHIHNRIDNQQRQNRRLEDLYRFGHFKEGAAFHQRFANMHRLRARNAKPKTMERWI